MSHCILLDERQDQNYYVISFSGTLQQCRNLQHDPGTSWSLPKPQWVRTMVEGKNLVGPFGHVFTGQIVTLEPATGQGE